MLDKIYATQPQTCAEFLKKIKIYTAGDLLAKRRNWTSSKIEKKAEMEKEKAGEGVPVKVIRHDTSNEVQKDSAWEQQFKKLQMSTHQMRVEMENLKNTAAKGVPINSNETNPPQQQYKRNFNGTGRGNNSQGGYNQGGYQTNQGGYQNNQGGYQNNQGGYQTNQSGGQKIRGGYQNNQGGYQTNQSGGQNNRGGYQNNRGRFQNNQGGFQTNQSGGQNNQGGYQTNQFGGQNSRGGYQNNHGGYLNNLLFSKFLVLIRQITYSKTSNTISQSY